jgi:hypothetical protein
MSRPSPLVDAPVGIDAGGVNARREWLVDLLIGGLLGGAIGAIVAVNLIITAGVGYDVTLAEVFEESLLLGIATVAILLSGPIVGVALRRRWRRRRLRVG